MKNYPVLIYPYKYKDILSTYPPISPPPQEPIKPTIQENILLEAKHPKQEIKDGFIAFIWGNILLCIGATIYTPNSLSSIKLFFTCGLLIIISLVCILLGLISIFSTVWNYKREKLRYYRNVRKNRDNALDIKRKFDASILEYNTIRYPNHLKEIEEYKLYRVNVRSEENINSYRIAEIKKYFKEAVPPIKTKNIFPIGKAESDFFLFLKTKSNNFHKDVALKLPVLTKSSYMPDIVYYDSTYNFSIDIEIDEPYEKTNKSAIHYIYKYPFSIDDDRNIFFTANNWIVIRFAEIQIVQFPDECWNYIKNVCDSLITAKIYDVPFSNQTPRWTKQESEIMATNNHRDTYLKKSARAII